MPYHVAKRGEKFCVVKDSTGEPVPGGCHPTKAAANKHIAALYINEKIKGSMRIMTSDELDQLKDRNG